MTFPITNFGGLYFFLSNFYVADDGFCVEMAYQAAKTTDPIEQAWVLASPDPKTAKHRGYKVRKRPDWEIIRVRIMRSLLRTKFTNPILRDALLATGDTDFIEGNFWHDKFWGAAWDHESRTWIGENWLGRLLMELRSELVAQRTRENEDEVANA